MLSELIDVVGTASAFELVRRWSGRSLYVPATMVPGHPIALSIGMDSAVKLSISFGGMQIRFPVERNALRAERNKRMFESRKSGASYSMIANEYGVCRSAAIAICRKMESLN